MEGLSLGAEQTWQKEPLGEEVKSGSVLSGQPEDLKASVPVQGAVAVIFVPHKQRSKLKAVASWNV